MSGVANRIPRGWRNIQAVHIKTADSVALPIYHTLPPEAKLLGPLEEPPAEKRVKLSDEEEESAAGDIGEAGDDKGEVAGIAMSGDIQTPRFLVAPTQKEKVMKV